MLNARGKNSKRNYLIGSAIVWLGLIVSTAIMVDRGDQLAMLLVIQGAGAFWFLVIAPQLFD